MQKPAERLIAPLSVYVYPRVLCREELAMRSVDVLYCSRPPGVNSSESCAKTDRCQGWQGVVVSATVAQAHASVAYVALVFL